MPFKNVVQLFCDVLPVILWCFAQKSDRDADFLLLTNPPLLLSEDKALYASRPSLPT
jgi:hypothetical protein